MGDSQQVYEASAKTPMLEQEGTLNMSVESVKPQEDFGTFPCVSPYDDEGEKRNFKLSAQELSLIHI